MTILKKRAFEQCIARKGLSFCEAVPLKARLYQICKYRTRTYHQVNAIQSDTPQSRVQTIDT